ncbi:PAS domain-containing protein [[Pseudomonas] carboxydohydrogena]|uniref:PAS domain-containing protein n=1 Tax=Afipia carboxydohydrogena TaxID=290 RepID=A0ABY8BRW8_AFICR|nr:PAS domain-containing protein [[Pseudomonas] carboxydohydrogena]WEF52745.1 PAS domain-containing protein [[Pseudomonas] carboxydohydrogena]
MGRAISANGSLHYGHTGVCSDIFKRKPVGDLCLDIAKFAEDRDCRMLEYLMKLAATEAYECLDAPIEPHTQMKSFGVWDWDISSNLVYADAATARLFSVDPEKSKKGLDLRYFEASIHPDDMPKYSSALLAAATNGGDFEARYRLIVNGRLEWISAKGFCFLSKGKTPTRFPGVLMAM